MGLGVSAHSPCKYNLYAMLFTLSTSCLFSFFDHPYMPPLQDILFTCWKVSPVGNNVCNWCQVCVHMLTCTWMDFIINHTICKHMHLVASNTLPNKNTKVSQPVPISEPKIVNESSPQDKTQEDKGLCSPIIIKDTCMHGNL